MIVDIFYPIFTLTITILASFMRKKKQNYSGDLHPCLHQGITLDSRGAYSSPRPPAAIVFCFAKNRCTHIFSVLSPASSLVVQRNAIIA